MSGKRKNTAVIELPSKRKLTDVDYNDSINFDAITPADVRLIKVKQQIED